MRNCDLRTYIMRLITLLMLFLAATSSVLAVDEPIVLECESAQLGSNFATGVDAAIHYVYPLTNNPTANPSNASNVMTFSVTFPQTGYYALYVRMRVGSGAFNDDSFFYGKTLGSLAAANSDLWALSNGLASAGYSSIDAVVDAGGTAGAQVWKWVNVSRFSFTTPNYIEVTSANEPYTFQIGSREDGLDIDKIAFCKADFMYTVKNLDRAEAGINPTFYSNNEATYVNPVLPGDQPDPSFLKVGNDFYASGSSFHTTPYGTIWHSTDLIHWELISRVVPTNWSALGNVTPSGGLWGGTITYFYGSYWYYFSNGGQYFCKAASPSGPWSAPVKVNGTSGTGYSGYDNSIFVDDDGTPYMLIKPGQFVNRIQRIHTDGHLTLPLISLDWLNTGAKYSYAEGPVMCKRKGWYYYFFARNVGGGQYVMRSQTLTSDSLSWTFMGDLFEPVSDPNALFRNPNHIAQPFMLSDSTWWTISQSYEALGSDAWDGKGRQGLLHQITWDANGKPIGKAASSMPVVKPALSNSNIPWRLPRSDQFSSTPLQLNWQFLNKASAERYSLTTKPGWIALTPGLDSCHLLQKDAGHYYTMTTRVLLNASSEGQSAGLYITNGNMSKSLKLTTNYANGKKLTFSFLTTKYEVSNVIGDTVWLRLDRREHLMAASYSADGLNWTSLGAAMDVKALDMAQENYNWWIGNSQGLFAKGKTAYFDSYAYRDGFSALSLAGKDNFYGIEAVDKTVGKVVSNTSELGGWLLLGGTQIGRLGLPATKLEVTASSTTGGTLEIWLNRMDSAGSKIAEIPISSTGNVDTWTTFSAPVTVFNGQYDVYLRFRGPKNAFYLKTIKFSPEISVDVHQVNDPSALFSVFPNPSNSGFRIRSSVKQQTFGFEIFNGEGVTMEKGSINESEMVGERLIPGTYFLKLNHENTTKLVKVIKSN